jgi:hypothetical protein
METVKISRDREDLIKLDVLGESALKSTKLMDLIVNGATLMSVNKDTLRGIIRVIITGAAAEVTHLQEEIPHWIPVSEKLPEDDPNIEFYDDGRLRFTTVLGVINGHTEQINRLSIKKTGSAFLDEQATDRYVWGNDETVTYWQPLPQPPKGETP